MLGSRHERLRRRINNGVKEMWYYLGSELKKLKNGANEAIIKQIDDTLENGAEHQRYGGGGNFT